MRVTVHKIRVTQSTELNNNVALISQIYTSHNERVPIHSKTSACGLKEVALPFSMHTCIVLCSQFHAQLLHGFPNSMICATLPGFLTDIYHIRD